ncbi:AlpA family transcriptional regulator [uncultured Vibrio sp.]|uniref:AlpA family transcriptional regulator n=1 Tax=uncultured Vibrio sp. TaxID=114054 RepID=UPI0026028A0A|nr:AlpA family transcriptional regulator [uncultured Vibrio sp.]
MRLIKLKEVIAVTGLSRSSIYKYMDERQFPQSVSLGERSVAWVEDEVQDWILERVAERDQQAG